MNERWFFQRKAAANDMQSATTMVSPAGFAACCAGYGVVDVSRARCAKNADTAAFS